MYNTSYTGYFCRLNTVLHPVDDTQDWSFHLAKNEKAAIRKFCMISIIIQTIDKDINLDQNFWAKHSF